MHFIHNIPRTGPKPGLRRIRALLDRMGNPQRALRCIHVAGTNGKGSTCAMLSHIYAMAGYRTGLFLSPFITDFRERLQISNRMISREELAREVEAAKPHWEAMREGGETPSEFELVTALAFSYFQRMNCDLVVLETGLGGLTDATNVISRPLASVLTAIGLDHTGLLGERVEQVAEQKCGIIKQNGVTVTCPGQDPAALAVIMEHCAAGNNQLLLGMNPEIVQQDLEGSRFRYGGEEYRLPLLGAHQINNAVTAIETVKAVGLSGFAVSRRDLQAGLAQTAIPARLEVLGRRPLILLDGAHNPAGAQVLRQALALLGDRPVHGVVGMMQEKDVEPCLACLLPRLRTVAVTAPSMPKAMPPTDLAAIARRYCGEVSVADSPAAAVQSALARCGRRDAVLLFGSLYLSGELRPIVLESVESRPGPAAFDRN